MNTRRIEADKGFTLVESAAELEEILGPVSERARTKVRSVLHELDRQWLAASPLLSDGDQ